jgi:hypothetical protein
MHRLASTDVSEKLVQRYLSGDEDAACAYKVENSRVENCWRGCHVRHIPHEETILKIANSAPFLRLARTHGNAPLRSRVSGPDVSSLTTSLLIAMKFDNVVA